MGARSSSFNDRGRADLKEHEDRLRDAQRVQKVALELEQCVELTDYIIRESPRLLKVCRQIAALPDLEDPRNVPVLRGRTDEQLADLLSDHEQLQGLRQELLARLEPRYLQLRSMLPDTPFYAHGRPCLASSSAARASVGASGLVDRAVELIQQEGAHRILLPGANIKAGSVVALADALSTNATVRELVLDNNPLNARGCATLFQALAGKPSLTALSIQRVGLAPRSGLDRVIQECPQLTALNLARNDVDDAVLHALAVALVRPQSRLKLLNLRSAYLCETSLDPLRTLTNAIDVGMCRLQALGLRSNSVSNSGAEIVAETLRQPSCPLLALNLDRNRIGDKGATALGEALRANGTLQVLHLHYNEISPVGFSAIADGLKAGENTALTTLDLNRNLAGAAGASYMAGLVRQTTSLKSLNLGDNALGLAGAREIADALSANQSLTAVNLGGNQIGPAGCMALTQALATQDSPVRSLNVRDNELGVVGAEELCRFLQTPEAALEYLHMASNSIGPRGGAAVAAMLRHNARLKVLVLGDEKNEENYIGNKAGKVLAQALAFNTTLERLFIFNNCIGVEAADQIHAAFASRDQAEPPTPANAIELEPPTPTLPAASSAAVAPININEVRKHSVDGELPLFKPGADLARAITGGDSDEPVLSAYTADYRAIDRTPPRGRRQRQRRNQGPLSADEWDDVVLTEQGAPVRAVTLAPLNHHSRLKRGKGKSAKDVGAAPSAAPSAAAGAAPSAAPSAAAGEAVGEAVDEPVDEPVNEPKAGEARRPSGPGDGSKKKKRVLKGKKAGKVAQAPADMAPPTGPPPTTTTTTTT